MAQPMRRTPALLLLTSALAACNPPAPPPGAAGPVEAAQAFSGAVQKGDAATAWSLLSSRTHAAADARAAAARLASGLAEPESGRHMLFGAALPQGPLEARLLDQSGDEAHVAAGAQRYRVVREGGRWLLDLDVEPAARDAGAGR